MRLWCEQAWLGGDAPDRGVLVDVDGDRFGSVQANVARPPGGAHALAGLVLPGFADAHSHAFHRALRGRTHGGRGTFWTWRDAMYALARRLDPDRLHRLARAAFAEAVLAGFTTVGDFHYLHHGPDGRPYDDVNAMGAALAAAAGEAGVRLTLIDACYLRGGFDRPVEEHQCRFSDGDADRWADRADEAIALERPGRVRIGAAIHSVRAVPPEALGVVAGWAAAHDRPLHAHVSEQRAENDACVAATGCTPTALLERAGARGPTFTAVHATHPSAADVALLGASGASVCICATTERDLADGIGPARALHEAGARLCVGTDSRAVVDPFEETRAVELDERLARAERGNLPVRSLLDALTTGGAHSLGWDTAGRIAPGHVADLVRVDVAGVRLAGVPARELLAGVVFAAAPADVRDVMVGGRWIVRDGHHERLDVAGELRTSIAAVWP
ncbi:MAG: formimidoylglutamate deiminase [Actinobacteria bacterium]|nr:formimidoylglutamate deiminase [Actinomycetota bacterium]